MIKRESRSFFKYNKKQKSTSPDVVKGGKSVITPQDQTDYEAFLKDIQKISPSKEKSLKSRITL